MNINNLEQFIEQFKKLLEKKPALPSVLGADVFLINDICHKYFMLLLTTVADR